jgi:hypothetical protein
MNTLINSFAGEKSHFFSPKFRETFWFLCHINFEHSRDVSHIKYLSMRSGKLRVFSTNTNAYLSLRVFPRQRILSNSDIRVEVFLRKTESFTTVGPGSSGKVLVPTVEYVLGHFFMWICFRNSENDIKSK